MVEKNWLRTQKLVVAPSTQCMEDLRTVWGGTAAETWNPPPLRESPLFCFLLFNSDTTTIIILCFERQLLFHIPQHFPRLLEQTDLN